MGRTAAVIIAAALTSTVGLGGCSNPAVGTAPLVSLAEARTAVNHHWDINRQALRARSGAQARTLIEQVESGDALKLDEDTIAQEADARAGGGGTTPPPIPESTGVRVFVPRQATYPVVFLSIRSQVQLDPAGAPTSKTTQVLEFFRRASAADAWRNAGYADVGPDLAARLDIALDRDGYAAFADGSPGGGQLSTAYTAYVAGALAGHPAEAGRRVQPGPLTDQFVARVQKDLTLVPTLKRVATFSASGRQDGIKLRTRDGGRFVLFDNLYDVLTTPSTGSCIAAGPGSGTGGSFASATDHFLQNVGAVVAPGPEGPITILAESDNAVSVDTKACTGGTTI